MRTVPSSLSQLALLTAPFALFRGLSGADRDRLLGRAVLQVAASGDVLFRQGAPAAATFLVLDGRVEIRRADSAGHEQVLHVLGRGHLAGEVPMFRGGCYPASASCAGEARVLRIDRDGLLAALRQSPELALALLAGVSERLRVFVDLIEDLSLRDGSGRLAAALLRLADSAGGAGFRLPSTKAALATQLGMAPETLSRRLRAFQDQELIRVRGRTIELLRIDRLELLAGR